MPPRGAVELPLVIRCAGTKENALSTRLGALVVGLVSDQSRRADFGRCRVSRRLVGAWAGVVIHSPLWLIFLLFSTPQNSPLLAHSGVLLYVLP